MRLLEEGLAQLDRNDTHDAFLDKLEEALSDLAPQRVEGAGREQREAGMDFQKAGQLAEMAQKWPCLSLAVMLILKVVGATWKQCTPVAAPPE